MAIIKKSVDQQNIIDLMIEWLRKDDTIRSTIAVNSNLSDQTAPLFAEALKENFVQILFSDSRTDKSVERGAVHVGMIGSADVIKIDGPKLDRILRVTSNSDQELLPIMVDILRIYSTTTHHRRNATVDHYKPMKPSRDTSKKAILSSAAPEGPL